MDINVVKTVHMPVEPIVNGTIIGTLGGPALLYLSEMLRNRSLAMPHVKKRNLILAALLGGVAGAGRGVYISKGKQMQAIDDARKGIDGYNNTVKTITG